MMVDSLGDLVARELKGRRVVLAVSGGRDSVTLLHAAATRARDSVACVATFDHATGPHSARAVALVRRAASSLGVELIAERAASTGRTEAEWRAQRWSFLRLVARERGAQVATAHTSDDQIETVLMREMRGAGARGLAALAAACSVVRPLLASSRADVAAYASRAGLAWVNDPGNSSERHLRNRIRHDLLPALVRAQPSLARDLLVLGARAARLRSDVDELIDHELAPELRDGAIVVDRQMLLGYDVQALALLWPSLAARAGVTLDRRGTDRLVAFTKVERSGTRIPLSGGFEAVSHRGEITVRRAHFFPPQSVYKLSTGLELGGFRFDARDEAVISLWSAALPLRKRLTVRTWLAGDRMVPAGGNERRVKGLLRDSGVDAASRISWPVVLADDEIVWVPGVRRSSAASARSGRPVVTYHCERIDR